MTKNTIKSRNRIKSRKEIKRSREKDFCKYCGEELGSVDTLEYLKRIKRIYALIVGL